MAEYIKREDAIRVNTSQVEFCKSEGLDFSGKLHIDSIINNLKHIPAADVVERKTGKWIDLEADNDKLCKRIKDLSKWIPVTERLPEHSGDYLVYSVGGNWEQLSAIEMAFWDDKYFYVQSFFDVTHWMPLPEPPKDGEA